jgi:hypothetical protein
MERLVAAGEELEPGFVDEADGPLDDWLLDRRRARDDPRCQ